jgi:hypothetical protein
LIVNGVPRLRIKSSLLRYRLAGERRYPACTPAEHARAEKSAEESRDSFLESTAHQTYTREDEAAEADHSAGVQSEGFEGVHHGGRAAHIDRALSMRHAGDSEGKHKWCGGASHKRGLLFDLLAINDEVAESEKTAIEQFVHGLAPKEHRYVS